MEVPALEVQATKQADGSTTFVCRVGKSGNTFDVYSFNMPSADTTNLNTNVFGGATNATRTFNYAQSGTGVVGNIGYTSPT
jgi:hypothetical protein